MLLANCGRSEPGPRCGNGIVEEGEECEDRNRIDTDRCTNKCTKARCGDGIVWDPVEECDDGNLIGTDACTHACNHARCGDAVVWEGVEDCDQGPLNSDTRPNFCRTDCLLPSCGDRVTDRGEECDDGNTINGDGCEIDCSWTCERFTQEIDCHDGLPCTDDICDPLTHTCSNPITVDTTVICRPEAGPCDVAESCNGASDACPQDILLDVTHVCRASSGDCDAEEHCTGYSVDCPIDELFPDSHECRTSIGYCDTEEYCTGTTKTCPPDDFVSKGTPCDDGDFCTDDDQCDGNGLCIGMVELRDVASHIAAGSSHTCAVLIDGTVKCWGVNGSGQLGDGTWAHKQTPTNVSGLSSRATAIECGYYHTCAILDTGGVQCWGYNVFGQLGDGTRSDRNTPVDVSGLSSGVTSLAIGGNHSCALLSTGGVKCWGYNVYGQLGNGVTAPHETTPVDVSGLQTGVVAITAGLHHTCAVLSSGRSVCWGNNEYGQIGDGSLTARLTPVDVSGLSSGTTELSAGRYHTCALTNPGGILCWGHNEYGQLGNGTNTDSSIPVNTSSLSAGASAIKAGQHHNCALMNSGDIKCWGHNNYGQLGDGNSTDSTTPVDLLGLSSTATFITAGRYHTCALLGTGGVMCWGDNMNGQLGNGTTTRPRVPVDVYGLSSTIPVDIVAGGAQTFAILDDRTVKSWGNNDHGQLGNGTTINTGMPVDVQNLSIDITDLSSGHRHACATLSNGTAKCWGYNEYGQLGDGTVNDRTTPVDVSGLSSSAIAISCGGFHTCALLDTGEVECWGNNEYGQLGNGTTDDRQSPASVSGLPSGVLEIDAGYQHTCVVLDTGGVMCWGYNIHGQLGDGSTVTKTTPVYVSGTTSGIVRVSSGLYHTCAVTDTGGIICWGVNWYGQLGDGTEEERRRPVGVSGLSSGVSSLAAGYSHTCALMTTGGVKCWGYNVLGQIGNGSNLSEVHTPEDVFDLASDVELLSAGSNHACALLKNGRVKCWGSDRHGQTTGIFTGFPHPVLCMD